MNPSPAPSFEPLRQPQLTASAAARCAASQAARCGDASVLAAALQDARRTTLAHLLAYERALAATGLRVPYRAELNPPLWEAGHVAWFQEFWTLRNRERAAAHRASPDAQRDAPLLADADRFYDSSKVAHESRWVLELPDAAATRDYLARVLEAVLGLLSGVAAEDAALYVYRLALFHEDMHNEAAVYMANGLGFDLGLAAPPRLLPAAQLLVDADVWRLGYREGGFAFDNELDGLEVPMTDLAIDSQPVSFGRFMEFVEAGGYAQPRWWSEAGWAWRRELRERLADPREAADAQAAGISPELPRFVRRGANGWERRWFGHWMPAERHWPMTNVSCHEAEAWCRWAGRRLPNEAEWERAAMVVPGFDWGQVWEWTGSPFEPYPGFERHAYRDYSAPWFGTRRVLRGASIATPPRLVHPRFRNYFTPERNDIFAGFRSCAL